MMRDFDPKLTWNSSKDNIIDGFYRPALVDCKLYQRLAGYFSSSTFVHVVNEILDLIESDGQIQLVTSPKLSDVDKDIIEQSVLEAENLLSTIFLDDLKNDPDNLKIEFSKIMAYMLTNYVNGKPQLEIKIAIPSTGTGIYHQKIGIFRYKNEEKVAFAGSVNETGAGWYDNIENFTVFRSWSDETNRRGIIDNQMEFNDLWNNSNNEVRVFDLPHAVKEHLLTIRPESDKEFADTLKKASEIIDHKKTSAEILQPNESTINLRKHQIEAISKWVKNNNCGILEMATGTGKTFTAFGCMSRMQKIHERTVTVIACPQLHLVEQWKDNLKEWNSSVEDLEKINIDSQIVCNSDNPDWKKQFQKLCYDFNKMPLGSDQYILNNVVIFVTHTTLSLSDFTNKILDLKKTKTFLILDEVHNITESKSKKTLLDEFDLRLGLSATPSRHLDEHGTQILLEYFHGIVYTLDLKRAIHELHILCTYDYLPYYVELTSDEMEEYKKLTGLIAQIEEAKNKGTYHRMPKDYNPHMARAALIANAENKDMVLDNILNSELHNILDNTLIYCTNTPSPASPKGSPKQLERVQKILTDNGLVSDSITWEDKTRDRRHILDLLSAGHFDCVTAVGCLDEGVDVPIVEVGIFMASSGNPKQFIQRRGRILRKNEKTGKTSATIYDILVTPPISDKSVFILSQRKLMAKELLRHKEFASIASNKKDAIEIIRNVANAFKIDLDALSYDYIRDMS